MSALRIILNILIAISVLFLPWWVSAILALILLLLYTAYEVFFWGLAIDVFYSAPIGAFFGIEFIFVILFTVLFIFSRYCKKWFMFQDRF